MTEYKERGFCRVMIYRIHVYRAQAGWLVGCLNTRENLENDFIVKAVCGNVCTAKNTEFATSCNSSLIITTIRVFRMKHNNWHCGWLAFS